MEFKPSFTGTEKSKTPSASPVVEKTVHESDVENPNRRQLDGFHDYQSNMRLLGRALSKGGKAGLLAFIQETPIETFSQYFKRVSESNHNLRTKLERDMALHRGIVSEFEEAIKKMNTVTTEDEAYESYLGLIHFFKKDDLTLIQEQEVEE
jgi:hypothetical protein